MTWVSQPASWVLKSSGSAKTRPGTTNMLYALLKLVGAGELRYGAKWERPWTALQALIDTVSAKGGVRR